MELRRHERIMNSRRISVGTAESLRLNNFYDHNDLNSISIAYGTITVSTKPTILFRGA
ncbi:hypothetical protein WN55_11128 [Dufourea novaeangliae]|uniref:Uncharacterized protein n=1 Tax=Dufourea novaeangliae TaxID=178035 RepID=A0A154PBX8_DUFNO|nr:hypothetical protein WN55_11128 [Dufourea novaeangliae]